MANIYGNATITIAATWSKNSDWGCFSQRDADVHGLLRERGLLVSRALDYFPRHAISTDDSFPLLNRAWVFQERKMSTRILHFGKEQLYWECKTVFRSEDGYEDHDNKSYDLKGINDDDPTAYWTSAIEHYSKLELTYENDRLPAISALVKRMQPLRPDDVYIGGMWVKSILKDLVWKRKTNELPRPDRPDTVAPTWSWISITSQVLWSHTEPLSSLRLVDMTYDLTGPSHFGRVSEASIVLEGAFLHIMHKPGNVLECESINWPLSLTQWNPCWDFDIKTAVPPFRADQTFLVLLLSYDGLTAFGMIVRQLETGQYERVGTMYIARHDRDMELLHQTIATLPVGQFTIV